MKTTDAEEPVAKATGTGIPTNMGLDHVGIVVPDVQRAVEFLIDVFDAELDWEIRREPTPTAGERGWSSIFGVHPESYMAHVAMVRCGEHPLTQYVELFEWNSPDQAKPKDGWFKFSDLGNSYISFSVKDIESVIKHIKEKVFPKWPGTRFIQDPPMNFPLRGEVCTSTFLVAPWGQWIELTCWSKSKELGRVIKAQQVPTRHPSIGASIQTLPTPAFMVDLDVVDHNTKLISERASAKGMKWRVPCKAHKSPDLAKYILERSNAEGVVLLTLAEAERFAAAGIDDIYLANQLASPEEIERLSLLAKKVKRLTVAVDSAAYLAELAVMVKSWEITTPIEVLVELNINHNRCGVSVDEAVRLARLADDIARTSGAVIFAGITGYEGHTPVLPPAEKTHQTRLAHSILKEAREKIEAAGIRVGVVSGGGSCNYIDCLEVGILTELQAGGGAICDLLYCNAANLREYGHRPGALLLTQVVSMPDDKSRAIGNAGFKATGWHPFGGLPQPRDRNDLEVIGLSAEHTKIKVKDPTAPIARGDKIVLIPGYTDAMGFLHRTIYGIRSDRVVEVWNTVSDTTW